MQVLDIAFPECREDVCDVATYLVTVLMSEFHVQQLLERQA